jgi:hypothetical protein
VGRDLIDSKILIMEEYEKGNNTFLKQTDRLFGEI